MTTERIYEQAGLHWKDASGTDDESAKQLFPDTWKALAARLPE